LLPANSIAVTLYCMVWLVSVKLTLQNSSESKIILLVLYVNRRTILMSPNHNANCTGYLYGTVNLSIMKSRRITYKVATITYRTRNCQQPGYLLDSLISYKPARTLRSSSSDLLIVPQRVKTVTASRAFRVAAPTIWNNLPDYVKVADSFNVLKRRLKCHLFDAAF